MLHSVQPRGKTTTLLAPQLLRRVALHHEDQLPNLSPHESTESVEERAYEYRVAAQPDGNDTSLATTSLDLPSTRRVLTAKEPLVAHDNQSRSNAKRRHCPALEPQHRHFAHCQ